MKKNRYQKLLSNDLRELSAKMYYVVYSLNQSSLKKEYYVKYYYAVVRKHNILKML